MTMIRQKTLTIAVASLATLPMIAQTVIKAPTKTVEVDAVIMTPFEVTTTKDTGYQAAEKLAGTRIRNDLRELRSQHPLPRSLRGSTRLVG